MSRTKGREVLVYVNNEVVALATACDLQVQGDMTEYTSPLSGRGKRNRPGRYGWTLAFDSLFSRDGEQIQFLRYFLNKTPLTVTMKVPGEDNPISGQCFIQTWSENAPLAGMASFKVTMVGDGDIVVPPAV